MPSTHLSRYHVRNFLNLLKIQGKHFGHVSRTVINPPREIWPYHASLPIDIMMKAVAARHSTITVFPQQKPSLW